MVYLIFAYDKDAAMLHMCVEQLRRVDKDAQIYVASDANAPIKTVPDGTVHFLTRFERGGNLNGLSAVLGTLDTMRWVMQETANDYVVKIDPDTWFNSVDWLKEGVDDYLALEAAEPFYPGGNAYRVSRWAVDGVLRYVRGRIDRGEWPVRWHYPEDRTILNSVRALRLSHRLLPYSSGMTTGYHDELPLPERVRAAAVVHCGEPTPAGRASREHVTLRMKILKHELEK